MKELILVPMSIGANLGMIGLFRAFDRLINDNRGEVNPADPSPEPAPEPTPSPEPAPVDPAPEPSAFDSFVSKKGFKNNDAIAKSYEEVEAAHHRTQNTFNSMKQQLEGAGYAVDDKGQISQKQHDPYLQPQTPQAPYQQQQQQAEPIYDPYTGTQLTDPFQIQLAQMPVGQREAFIFNAMSAQQDKLRSGAVQAEQEILAKPEAKGFESDVKQVMMNVPPQQRADKGAWERALYEVKGRRYDQDRQNWGKDGVEAFINKEGAQGLNAVSGSGVSVKLTPQQETTYTYYATNHPGMFKDKTHFLKANQNTYGA